MSKAVKTIIGVAAAIAIPFAAPVIASSIATSFGISAATFGVSATVGSVLGSAAVGTVLGGASQAVLGGSFLKGALTGGIGGGIGGFISAPSAAAAQPTFSAIGQPPAGLNLGAGEAATGFGGAAPATTFPVSLSGAETGAGFDGLDYSLTSGVQFPTGGFNPATAGVGFQAPNPGFFQAGANAATAAGVPLDYSLGAYAPPSTGLQLTTLNPITGGTQTITGSGAFQAAATPSGQVPAPNKPLSFIEALKRVPGEIAAKFSDPKALADLTLRAAGNLAGSALAGDGLTDAERALLDAQTEELRTLQQNNAGLFALRLEQAQNLIGESKYFDPEYFGLQRARRAQTAGARAKQAGLRGLEGPVRTAEARRFDLATARDTGSAFDQGLLQGISGRLSTIQAGLNALPKEYPNSTGSFSGLRASNADAALRARQRALDIGSLFGSLTGTEEARSRGR